MKKLASLLLLVFALSAHASLYHVYFGWDGQDSNNGYSNDVYVDSSWASNNSTWNFGPALYDGVLGTLDNVHVTDVQSTDPVTVADTGSVPFTDSAGVLTIPGGFTAHYPTSVGNSAPFSFSAMAPAPASSPFGFFDEDISSELQPASTLILDGVGFVLTIAAIIYFARCVWRLFRPLSR